MNDFLDNKLLTNKIKNLNEDNLEDFILNAYSEGEAFLEKAYNGITKTRNDLGTAFSGKLMMSIEEIAYLMEGAESKFLVRWAERCIKKIELKEIQSSIFNKYGSDINGLEMSKKNLTEHIVITPDASVNGGFRATLFNAGGFKSHKEYKDYSTALDGVVKDGYKIENPGILESLSKYEDFYKTNKNIEKLKKRACKINF
jgi:hypothetical protein